MNTGQYGTVHDEGSRPSGEAAARAVSRAFLGAAVVVAVLVLLGVLR